MLCIKKLHKIINKLLQNIKFGLLRLFGFLKPKPVFGSNLPALWHTAVVKKINKHRTFCRFELKQTTSLALAIVHTSWAKKANCRIWSLNFVKYWPIFNILLPSLSLGNLQDSDHKNVSVYLRRVTALPREIFI